MFQSSFEVLDLKYVIYVQGVVVMKSGHIYVTMIYMYMHNSKEKPSVR